MSGPLRHLHDVPVLHWHGDTHALPLGAINLASTPLVEQQAFSIGSNILGLQFHPEAETDLHFERWLVGHAVELAAAGIDIAALRQDGREQGEALRLAAKALFQDWLAGLETGT